MTHSPGDPSRREAIAVGLGLVAVGRSGSGGPKPRLRAGAAAVDISPTRFPVTISGSFLSKQANKLSDRLHARALVLDDGTTRLALVVVDTLMMSREMLDTVKAQAATRTGIPTENILIAATHTHSAPCVVGALGTDPDPHYSRFLPGKLVEAIVEANARLAPARAGWAVAADPDHTHCRRWILRPDRMRRDPFGGLTVRAHMHPGWSNPHFLGPAGPVDDQVCVLAVQHSDGRPLALLANYSMHYAGAPPVSADYFGVCAAEIEKLLPGAVGFLSQGTSGDLHWMDYSLPARRPLNRFVIGRALARIAAEAYKTIVFRDHVTLAACEKRLTLRRRVPDPERLEWAKEIVARMQDRPPRNLQEVYAREQIFLANQPTRELKLQAMRIGQLGITAIPCEVFGITGLKLKAQSPLAPTMNLELANGAEGYIPPPEQHDLGGYTTWPARSAGLETQAEPRIVQTLLEALEEVADAPRRTIRAAIGPYRKAILATSPLAYWPLDDIEGYRATDIGPNALHARYEAGAARYLPGPASDAFCGPGRDHRAAHFAGGRLRAKLQGLGPTYTVELWFWNAMPNDARKVTGYLVSRGPDGKQGSPGDSLGIGGTHSAQRKLFLYNGDTLRDTLAGKTLIEPKTWHHLVLVRDRERAIVYLDGKEEIRGELPTACPADCPGIFIGGRNDGFASLEGRICEVAIYPRALTPAEAARHHHTAAGPST